MNCEFTEELVVEVELPLPFQMQTYLPQNITKTPLSGKKKKQLVLLTLYKGKLKDKIAQE